MDTFDSWYTETILVNISRVRISREVGTFRIDGGEKSRSVTDYKPNLDIAKTERRRSKWYSLGAVWSGKYSKSCEH